MDVPTATLEAAAVSGSHKTGTPKSRATTPVHGSQRAGTPRGKRGSHDVNASEQRRRSRVASSANNNSVPRMLPDSGQGFSPIVGQRLQLLDDEEEEEKKKHHHHHAHHHKA